MRAPHVGCISGLVSRESARIDADVRSALEAFPDGSRRQHEAFVLTAAELRVLRLVGLGMTNDEIGEAMRIAFSTVRAHVKTIHDKCGVKGRARLAVVATLIAERGLWREVREASPERKAEERARRREMLMEMVA